MSYYVKTLDANKNEIEMEVSYEVYQLFEDERKQEERYKKECSRRRSATPYDDDVIPNRVRNTSPEDLVISRDVLNKTTDVIESCTLMQQNRFLLNKVSGYTISEIAQFEGKTKGTIQSSIDTVTKKIKNNKI